MSVQQALNNILASGTVAAGLYAHSPEAQTQAKVKELHKERKNIEAAIETAKDFPSTSEANKLYSELYSRAVGVERELVATDPNKQNVRYLLSDLEGAAEWEDAMQMSYSKRLKTIKDQSMEFQKRQEMFRKAFQESEEMQNIVKELK